MRSGNPRMLVIILVATGVMVAAIAALALDSWVLLGVLLGLHAVTSAIVVGYTFKRAKQSEDKPDPVTEARIEDERSGA